MKHFQSRPDVAIPAETLRNAQGIILLEGTKAGFVFAYQGGGGVAMVKDTKARVSGARLRLWEQSQRQFRFAGWRGETELLRHSPLIELPEATHRLSEAKFKFGGEASGTVGDVSGRVQGNVLTPNSPSVLVYDARRGLYGGAEIRGGSLSPDDKANSVYYGRDVTMSGILFDHQVQTTDAAAQLAKTDQLVFDPTRSCQHRETIEEWY